MTLSRATLRGRPVVVIRYEIGDGRLCGFACRLHQRPRKFLAGFIYPTRVATQHREWTPERIRVGRGRALGPITFALRQVFRAVPLDTVTNPVRMKFIGALKAPRRLFHFNSALQPSKQSARRFSKCLSRVVAPAFHKQDQTMGRIPNDGKSEARSGNSTARDGNYAC